MATIGKKKSTPRRKTGAKAKAPGRKRKARVGAAATPKTKTFSGERFTKSACGLTKAEAGKRAENHRKKGAAKKARVTPNAAGKGYCVFVRG